MRGNNNETYPGPKWFSRRLGPISTFSSGAVEGVVAGLEIVGEDVVSELVQMKYLKQTISRNNVTK
jgi:hypothetical protein